MKKMKAAVFAATGAVSAQDFLNVEKNGREQLETILRKSQNIYVNAYMQFLTNAVFKPLLEFSITCEKWRKLD